MQFCTSCAACCMLHAAHRSLLSLGRAVALVGGHKLKFWLPLWWEIFVACQKLYKRQHFKHVGGRKCISWPVWAAGCPFSELNPSSCCRWGRMGGRLARKAYPWQWSVKFKARLRIKRSGCSGRASNWQQLVNKSREKLRKKSFRNNLQLLLKLNIEKNVSKAILNKT